MQYSFRCILDVDTDVIRDISIDANSSLQDFHKSVVDAFGFTTQEMAAFYRTDDEWDQGEEIPLISMSATDSKSEMKDYKLSEIFSDIHERLLYVYDFLSMWTFFIELHEIDINKTPQKPVIGYRSGDLPNEAPEKQFTSEKILDDFEKELGDEFGDEFDIDDVDNEYF